MHHREKLAVIAVTSVLCAFSTATLADDELGTVMVTATRQKQRVSDALADVSIISRAEIEQAGQTTLVELLARQAEIQTYSSGGAGKLGATYIRGANSNHTLVFVDGVRMGTATAGTPSLEQIPLSQIDHVEILRGPGSALYGADAIGGVIQIFTKRGEGRPAPELFAGAGGNGTRNLAAGFSGAADALSYSLRTGYDSTDGIKAISDKGKQPYSYDPARTADGFRNASVTGSLAFRPAAGHELGATLFHTDGRNWYEGGPGFDTRADVSQSAYSVYSRDRFTDAWTSTLRLSESVDDSNTFASYSPTGSRYKTTQDQASWQNDVRTAVGSVMVALESLQQKALAQGSYDTRRTINSAQLGWTGRYGAHRLQINLRNDDNSQFGGKTTGYGAYGYQITPALRAAVSMGTAFHAPSFNDLYYPGYSNPSLKPENARNKEGSLVWEEGTSLLRLSIFDNQVSDMIVSSASTGYIPQNVSHASLQGESLSAQATLAGLDAGGSLDYLDARNSDTNKRLPRRAMQQVNLHLGKTQGAWSLLGEFQAVGSRFDSTTETNRMGGYALLNLVARYAANRDWSVEGRANNVFNRQYETAWGYGTPGANLFVGVRYAPK
ncbi:MAG: TonB-dependent receptor [Rhodocyclaceae bacterium]|nr:TonB-dependent receptor [Rhodocyclaceae bacterium]